MTPSDSGLPGTGGAAEAALVRQFWWLHDARWYQAVKTRFGADAANELNAEVMQFVARRVATVYARMNPGESADTTKDVATTLESLARLMFAESVRLRATEFGDDGTWETEISEHFALKMLKATRSLAEYRCPCLELRGGWFEGLGITADDEVVACMREGAAVCRFRACLHDRSRDAATAGGAA